MKHLADYDIDELKALLAESPLNAPAYRAGQLFKWISMNAVYDEMSNIPKSLREQLASEYSDVPLSIIREYPASDHSVKLLYRLLDDNVIEGIYMPHSYGNTLCVSTQVGCRMGCAFCSSGIGGLVRNLSAGEIYGQVAAVNRVFSHAIALEENGSFTVKESNPHKEYPQKEKEGLRKRSRALSNVVLMGSGEPLDNYDNTVKFLRLACAPEGLNLSPRGISLSTCGLPDKIRLLADDGFSVTLSVSLHATTDEIRSTLMPAAKKYTIAEVIDAARYYFDRTGRRVAIEYALIKNVNMTVSDQKRLRELARNMSCHINLIMLNYVKESSLSPCSKAEADTFLQGLKDLGLSVTLRKSAGGSVSGACGQLRRKFVGDKQD